ncbi:MFS transporter [Streptomyces sp. NPDC001661]
MSAPPARTTARSTTTPSPGKIITAACVGNALEWYDIAVYSYFATYLSKVFFTDDDPALALLLTLGTFGVSFLIRPVGALVLGSYADRAGRKAALTWSIGLMALGTLLICVMPSYAAIGAVAPVGILLARLIQGFAAGGEFGSATALMVEFMPNRRGFAASWQFTSQAASTLLAALLGTVLTSTLSEDQLTSWGFRIPFLVGLLVAPVGLYIRRNVPEPPTTAREPEAAHAPVRTMLREHKTGVLLTIGLLAVTTCLNYLITYIPTYATKTLGLPDSTGFVAALAGGLVLLAVTSVAGHFSDRVGQIAIMIPASGRRPAVDLPDVRAPRVRALAGPADRRRHGDGALQGLLLRTHGRTHGRHLPGRDPSDRDGGGLQHRRHRLRRLHTDDRGVAARYDRPVRGPRLLGGVRRRGEPDQPVRAAPPPPAPPMT